MKTFARFSWDFGSSGAWMEIDTDDIQDIVYYQDDLWIYTVAGKRYRVHGRITFVKHD